jgi:hypothetical protein
MVDFQGVFNFLEFSSDSWKFFNKQYAYAIKVNQSSDFSVKNLAIYNEWFMIYEEIMNNSFLHY